MAAFLAVMFTQVGFLAHDAGHRQVFGSQRASYRHHAHPNTEDADPDIAAGALVFTAAQAQASRGAARLVYRYQAYLFFPMLLGEAIGLHVASIRALRSQASRHRSWEAALLAAHVAGYLTVVFLVLSPVKAMVFILVQQGVFGLYLGCSFAPNHKGMPVLGPPTRATSCAARCSPPAMSAAAG